MSCINNNYCGLLRNGALVMRHVAIPANKNNGRTVLGMIVITCAVGEKVNGMGDMGGSGCLWIMRKD